MTDLNFLDSLSNAQITLTTIVFSLLFSFFLGIIIAFVYKRTNQGFSYDSSFCFTLVMITVIVNAIMITIGSNIALSLGLIGSLSIIRFRTAIKNSMDMAFLFWCIAVGLAVGAYQYPTAIAVTIMVTIAILSFNKSRFFFKTNTDYIITVNTNTTNSGKEIENILSERNLSWKMKSGFSNEDGSEITYSVYSNKKVDMDTVTKDINNLHTVKSVTLLSPETNLFI